MAKAKAKAKAKKATKKRAAKPAARRQAKAPKVAHPVVHWEVQAQDPARQQRFFSELFGWTIDANNPMNYGMVTSGGADGIDGGIGGTQDAPRVTVYVQVPDINAVLAKAESLGARTVMPRSDVGMIILAQFRDTEGNIIGLVEG